MKQDVGEDRETETTTTRRGRKKGSRRRGRRPGRPKGTKVAKRRGRPAGTGRKGRRGRTAGTKAGGSSLTLPLSSEDLQFWNTFIVFLNANSGKDFVVQTDGTNYSLRAV